MSIVALGAHRVDNSSQKCRTKALSAAIQVYEPFLEHITDKLGLGEGQVGASLAEISSIVQKAALDAANAAVKSLIQDAGLEGRKRAPCPQCGKERTGRLQARTIETRFGEVTFERPYHYCKACKLGFAPFDVNLALAESRKQDDLRESMLKLTAEVPFEKAAEIFTELTGISYSDRAAHDLVSEVGGSIDVTAILPSAEEIKAKIKEQTVPGAWRPIVVISADGAHIPMRPAGRWRRNEKRGKGEWHEAKGFRAYILADGKIVQLASWHQVCNEETFGKALEIFSQLLDHNSVRIGLVADGAKWIWKHFSRLFPSGRQVLDYYHCKQHLWKYVKLKFSDENEQLVWVESVITELFYGAAESVILGLERLEPTADQEKEELRKLIGYLKENCHRLDYGSARRAQCPLGSGAIESANKQICHVRMKRPGAWWGHPGTNNMLAIRCASVNGTLSKAYASQKRLLKIVETPQHGPA